MKGRLHKSMTVQDFDNGYWYVSELKSFADSLGIASAARMRKNELEAAIVGFLKAGALPTIVKSKPTKKGLKDIEIGLAMNLKIGNYTSNRQTKDFIAEAARRKNPGIKEKSGVWYRLNRWREAEMEGGKSITYGDLVCQYLALNGQDSFERIPHGRYINFVADFLKFETKATRQDALAAWSVLKSMEIPKTYKAWKAVQSAR